jgi:hypothetical protein
MPYFLDVQANPVAVNSKGHNIGRTGLPLELTVVQLIFLWITHHALLWYFYSFFLN